MSALRANPTPVAPETDAARRLHQSAGVLQYRPVGFRIWSEIDQEGKVRAWVISGDNLRGDIRIWMDGRPHPSPNAQHTEGGFATGKWEGDTLTARITHLKTAWIRRGVGIPASDHTTITMHLTRRENLLTLTTIQEDPYYLTEPHVVSRVWQWNPRGTEADRPICNTANEIPSLEDTGAVPHYLPGQNPEEDYMVRTFNVPKEAAMGYAETLYPEFLFITPKAGTASAFSLTSEITSGLQEMLAIFAGNIRPVANSQVNFEPLLQAGRTAGVMDWDEVTQPSFNFMGGFQPTAAIRPWPRASCCSRARCQTMRTASASEIAPETYAAATSPRLWPTTAAGVTPHDRHNSARPTCSANTTGCTH